jgi:hypothetical protein
MSKPPEQPEPLRLILAPREPAWARGYLAILQRDDEHWLAIAPLTLGPRQADPVHVASVA